MAFGSGKALTPASVADARMAAAGRMKIEQRARMTGVDTLGERRREVRRKKKKGERRAK